MIIEYNDAQAALAEGLAGSQSAFVDLMNRCYLKKWPTPISSMSTVMLGPRSSPTARSTTIALRTIQDFPEFYKIYRRRIHLQQHQTGESEPRCSTRTRARTTSEDRATRTSPAYSLTAEDAATAAGIDRPGRRSVDEGAGAGAADDRVDALHLCQLQAVRRRRQGRRCGCLARRRTGRASIKRATSSSPAARIAQRHEGQRLLRKAVVPALVRKGRRLGEVNVTATDVPTKLQPNCTPPPTTTRWA